MLQVWSDGDNTLAAVHYQTFTLQDFETFNFQYNVAGCGECDDFNKPGMDSASPQHQTLSPTATLVGVSGDQCAVTLALQWPSQAVVDYGAPLFAQVCRLLSAGPAFLVFQSPPSPLSLARAYCAPPLFPISHLMKKYCGTRYSDYRCRVVALQMNISMSRSSGADGLNSSVSLAAVLSWTQKTPTR